MNSPQVQFGGRIPILTCSPGSRESGRVVAIRRKRSGDAVPTQCLSWQPCLNFRAISCLNFSTGLAVLLLEIDQLQPLLIKRGRLLDEFLLESLEDGTCYFGQCRTRVGHLVNFVL